MKMKKTLAFIMTAALTVGTLAGCSQATLNYSKELSNTAKWEASTSSIQGSINVDISGVKEEVTFTGTGYSSKNGAYVDMKFNNTSGKIKLPEIEEYVDGTTVYINKSYFEGIYTLTGQTVPEGLSKISEEFIGIDSTSMGMDIKEIQELATEPESMIKLGKTLFGDSGLDVPFVQSGREYTINLDANQAVDLSAKAIKAAANNLDNINNTFKLGFTTEMIAEAKKSVNDENFDKGLNEAKTALAGSTITSKQVFTDTSCTGDMNVNLKVKDAGTISFVMKSTGNKAQVEDIHLPASRIKLTAEEFEKISAPTETAISETTNSTTK